MAGPELTTLSETCDLPWRNPMIEISPLVLNHRLELGRNDDSRVHVMAKITATKQSALLILLQTVAVDFAV
jgi:hypothetical protein